MNQFNDRCGEIIFDNYGVAMKIINYKNNKDIIIEFQDEHKYKKRTTYEAFKNKRIKNPYRKSFYGIGYIGDGKYNISSKYGSLWSNMLARCYHRESEKNYYQICEVSKEWLNFQTFAKWCDDNYKKGWFLDKDILKKGNKLYSPNNCRFVPREINNLFTNRRNFRGDYPIGVSKHKDKYTAQCNVKGVRTTLGVFDNVEDAFLCYKNNKEKEIKRLANKYKDVIPHDVYISMINWTIDIND